MRRLIIHVDDVACCHGANVAMEAMTDTGLTVSGSIMVPSPWFGEAAEMADRRPDIDLGVHLTLTSESAALRWRPLTTTSPASGLVDADGFMWSNTTDLRRNADPAAVADELRAQIHRAQIAGVGVSHLDHHMGAALAPEFVEATIDVAVDHGLPTLFPNEIERYCRDVDLIDVDTSALAVAHRRLEAAGIAVGDRFEMGLTHQGAPVRETFERIIGGLGDGETFLSLHCAAPGDIDDVHPNDAPWRIAEYELFTDPGFGAWLNRVDIELKGFRRSS